MFDCVIVSSFPHHQGVAGISRPSVVSLFFTCVVSASGPLVKSLIFCLVSSSAFSVIQYCATFRPRTDVIRVLSSPLAAHHPSNSRHSRSMCSQSQMTAE